jgi:putative phosphoesterase
MRIIAITDVHGRLNQALKMAENVKREGVKAILLAGDLSRYKSIEEAYEILKALTSVGVKVFYVPGNMDDPKICEEVNVENAICIHEKTVEFEGYVIAGMGGALKGPFNTPFELSEEQILEILKKLMDKIESGKRAILVTHNPPYNTKVDELGFGEHVGSRSLRMIIEKYKPILNVCGHIHEARGMDNVYGTIVVNPGPLMYGYYSIIDFGEEVKVNLMKMP